MNSFVILVLIFLSYSFARVDGVFYFEMLSSEGENNRCTSFRINRNFGEKKFTFILYQCDTSERKPNGSQVRAKCERVEDLRQKEAIYRVANFYDVTDLTIIPGDSMKIDGYGMRDLSNIITVGYNPKDYDRPIFMPVSNDNEIVEEKAYKHLSRFVVNDRDRAFVNKLLRFCSVNNVAFFFFYRDTNLSLFEVIESVMEEMIAESGYTKEKELWPIVTSKVKYGAMAIKKTLSKNLSRTLSRSVSSGIVRSWMEYEQRSNNYEKFLTHAQHQTLGASVSRFMTWTLAQRLPPEETIELPPGEESEPEPEPPVQKIDDGRPLTKKMDPAMLPSMLAKHGSHQPTHPRARAKTFAKGPTLVYDPKYDMENDMEKIKSYKRMASSLHPRALPQVQSESSEPMADELEPEEHLQAKYTNSIPSVQPWDTSQPSTKGKALPWSQSLAKEPEPFDDIDISYREDELLGKYKKPISPMQPRHVSQPPTKERPRSQTLVNEQIDEIDAQYREDELVGKYKKPILPLKARDVSQPLKEELSQPLADNAKPIDELDITYHEDELLGKNAVPFLQPREMSTQPFPLEPSLSRERSLSDSLPLAKDQTNPQFRLRHELMKSAGYMVFKMFDPCFILRSSDEEREKAENICSLNCRMFSMAQQVYGVTFNPHCKHLKTGECHENLCICLPRCSYVSKPVGMIFCANALRLHIYEKVVKYKIRH